MDGIAFYAPMKPPTDPVPSGDRTMARNLIAALEGVGRGSVRLASEMRSRDGTGDVHIQEAAIRAAEAEVARIAEQNPATLWVTYHSYYKSPDLIGPAVAQRWGIPYVLVEATRARKRLAGPYARFAVAAEAACDAADVIFYLTERDLFALERDLRRGQRLIHLRPFLNLEKLNAHARREPGRRPPEFLACAMFRGGDKFASYAALALALRQVQSTDWRLTIVGDGPRKADVRAMFEAFGNRVSFVGVLEPDELAERYGCADALLWPGVNEAYGMVYLEAQAQGCPVLAEDRPGVRDVVRDGGWLVPPDEPVKFAAAIETLIREPQTRIAAGRKGWECVAAEHTLRSARETLEVGLAGVMGKTRD